MFNKPPQQSASTPRARIAHRPPSRGSHARKPSDTKASRLLGALVVEEPQTAEELLGPPPVQKSEKVMFGPERPPPQSPRASSSEPKRTSRSTSGGLQPGYSYRPSADGEWVLLPDPAPYLHRESSHEHSEEWAPATAFDDLHHFLAPPELAPNPALRFEHQLLGSPTFTKPYQLTVLRGTMFRLWVLKMATADILRDAAQELSRRGVMSEEQQTALEDMVPVYDELLKAVADSQVGREVDKWTLKIESTTLRKATQKEAAKVFVEADEKAEEFAEHYE